MSLRAHGRWIAILAAALSPAGAAAVDVTGRIGLLYERTESWMADQYTLLPRLRFDGSLAASGAVIEPRYGTWRGDVRYEHLDQTYSQSDEDSDIVGYSALVSLFERPGTVLGLTAGAFRGVADSASSTGGARLTGRTLDEAYQARIRVGRAAPVLTVGGSLRDSRNEGFARPDTTETTRMLDVGTQHGPGPYDLKLDYQGRWNEGSFEILNYASHGVNLHASSRVSSTADAYVTGRYFLRVPTALTSSNPRFEENAVTAGVRSTAGRARSTAQYSYGHLFFSAPGGEERERIRQTASAWSEIALTPAWAISPTADVTLTQDRIGVAEDSAWGASAGALVRWRRNDGRRDLWIEGGPRVGVVAPVDEDAELGGGGRLRTRASWIVGRGQLGADYSVDYERNLQATRGWGLRQVAQADASAFLAAGLRGRLGVSVSATRRHEDFLGDRASRDLLVAGSLDWRRLHLQLDAGLRDDVSPAIGTSLSGDGLLIPAEFDTHSRHAALSASTVVLRTVSLLVRGRFGQVSGPELPSEEEASLEGIVGYAVGQFQLSLEDRYTMAGRAGLDRRVNQFMVRLSRTFGRRF